MLSCLPYQKATYLNVSLFLFSHVCKMYATKKCSRKAGKGLQKKRLLSSWTSPIQMGLETIRSGGKSYGGYEKEAIKCVERWHINILNLNVPYVKLNV